MAQTVARHRQDLERALSTITSELLKEKGYLCFVDVFIKLGYLSKSDYENWRFKRVSPLERVLSLNLSRINFIMGVFPFSRSLCETRGVPELQAKRSWQQNPPHRGCFRVHTQRKGASRCRVTRVSAARTPMTPKPYKRFSTSFLRGTRRRRW
jgi:hypothetical protein